jgi:hypothetical protein
LSRGTARDFTGGFGTTQIAIGGARPEQTAYLMDGTNIADISDKAPSSLSGVLLGVDTVQVFLGGPRVQLINPVNGQTVREGRDLPVQITVSDASEIGYVTVEQSELDLLDASGNGGLKALAVQPWFERLLLEADPYRFPQQHVAMILRFGSEVNLANIAPGQILRLEGFRRGIGRAVDYAIISR